MIKRILTFIKLFLFTVLGVLLISILFRFVISIIKYPYHVFDVEYYRSNVSMSNLLTFAIVWSIINTPRYMKKAIIISMNTVEEAKALFANFNEVLRKDKWKADNKEIWCVSFSLLSIKIGWREKISLELLGSSVRVSGSKICIEKICKKVGFELST